LFHWNVGFYDFIDLEGMRQQWPNRFVYIIAAIGAAAGLGNLRRFPMLAYEYGGSAFILALLISNIVIVFPLLMMETVIWQKFQASGPKAFGKIKSGISWIQWLPILVSVFIFMYYAPIMSWGVQYLIQAFSGAFLSDPVNYFAQHILHKTTDIAISGGLQRWLLIALWWAFVAVFFALIKWIKSVSKVLKWTVPIPFLLLIVLWIRWITLPWGADGLVTLFVPDWWALLDIRLWQAAIGQSFFSASLAFWYFIFAWSHRKQKAEVPRSTIFILAGNFLVSLLAWIAVFSNLWYMANIQGVAVLDVVTGGPDLIFSVLPTAISLMPFFKIWFAVLLFGTVITLGMSSIFGFVEVIVDAFLELRLRKKAAKYLRVMLILLIIAFLGGIPFMFGAGIYYLDIMDHFVGGYLFMLVGLLETVVVLRRVGAKKLRSWIGQTGKLWKRFVGVLYSIPVVLAIVLGSALWQEFQWVYGGYEWKYVLIFGLIPLMVVVVGVVFLQLFCND